MNPADRRYPCQMAGKRAPGGRILVVEDEASISEPFAEALRRAGFDPVLTETAAGALELAEQAEPDLVMLDLALPDGDGRDVCRELRRRSGSPGWSSTRRRGSPACAASSSTSRARSSTCSPS